MPIESESGASQDSRGWTRPQDYYETQIVAILEDELFACPPLMPVVVAKMVGRKQDITKTFRLTKDVASTAELKHLRRIRDTSTGDKECIISSLNDCREDIRRQEQKLLELEQRFQSDDLLQDFRIIQVPSRAPKTEQQRDVCLREKLWPCKYAKSAHLTQCIDGSELKNSERVVIEVISNELLKFINSPHTATTSGAVLYRFNELNAIGLTNIATINENPCKHAAMLAIDRLAEHHGAGHWKDPNLKSWTIESEECLKLHHIIKEQLSGCPLALTKHAKSEDRFLPYLCNDLDVILTEEPCMMCTMALVQSRIKRVFYLNLMDVENEDKERLRPVCFPDQAIERFMVHRVKSLNHHFQAWLIKLFHRST